jgi:hypothetical protein
MSAFIFFLSFFISLLPSRIHLVHAPPKTTCMRSPTTSPKSFPPASGVASVDHHLHPAIRDSPSPDASCILAVHDAL